MTAANDETATHFGKSGQGRPSPLGWTLQRAIQVILHGVRHVEPNIVPVCVCGAIMFPLYWVVWKYLFPQPYENLALRLVGSALCLVIAAKDWWPATCRRYLPIAWLGMLLYTLPFFFTFMLLQNGTSDIWLMSTLSALFLMVLLVDWISLLLLFVVGSIIAWRIHLLVSPEVTGVNLYVEFVPIFLFAVIAGTIFNYKTAGIRQAGERARIEVGALVAKEMRSPLFSVRTHAVSLSKFLPALIRTYADEAARKDQPGAHAEPQLRALERVPVRIEEAVEQINSIIETLLVQGGQHDPGPDTARTLSMSHCLDQAIARPPLKAAVDRTRIIMQRDHDFQFYGSPTLMPHVLAGVIEASLDAVYEGTGAELVIELGQSGRWNYARLKDSSAALRPVAMAKFRRFGLLRTDKDFPNRPDLAFAKLVMERTGGSVGRTVEFGRTTEIVLWFPQLGTT